MIELPKDLNSSLVVGIGRHRVCYIHPEDEKKCIKVIHSASGNALRENQRELAYYAHLNRYLTDWRGIPRYYGQIETNLGIGYVYDRIVDFDGKPSRTLQDYFPIEELETTYSQLYQLLEDLKSYLQANKIVTMSIKPYNILCHRISPTKIFPVVCDNIGTASFFPLELYSSTFCRLKQKRIFERLEQLDIIRKMRNLIKLNQQEHS